MTEYKTMDLDAIKNMDFVQVMELEDSKRASEMVILQRFTADELISITTMMSALSPEDFIRQPAGAHPWLPVAKVLGPKTSSFIGCFFLNEETGVITFELLVHTRGFTADLLKSLLQALS